MFRDINSSEMSQLAHDIYMRIHSQKFGQLYDPKNDEEYTLETPTNNRPRRFIHGFTSSCRAAALIPVFLELMEKHRDTFSSDVQASLENFVENREQNVRKLQIVTLLRVSGRTVDYDSGWKFAKQGKETAIKYLKKHFNCTEDEATDWARCIEECDPPREKLNNKKEITDIRTILLGDATTLDTFRDTVRKTVEPKFFLAQILSNDKRAVEESLEQLVVQGRELILKQQGFCLVNYKKSVTETIGEIIGEVKYSNEWNQCEANLDFFNQMVQEVTSAIGNHNLQGAAKKGAGEKKSAPAGIKGTPTPSSPKGFFTKIVNFIKKIINTAIKSLKNMLSIRTKTGEGSPTESRQINPEDSMGKGEHANDIQNTTSLEQKPSPH